MVPLSEAVLEAVLDELLVRGMILDPEARGRWSSAWQTEAEALDDLAQVLRVRIERLLARARWGVET